MNARPGGRGFFTHQQSILLFDDGLAWLMQVTMFLTLGGQVFPARLVPIAWVSLLISLFLIFVAPCEYPHSAGFSADAVSRTDSCCLSGTLCGRVDYTDHVSRIGRDQASRHDLPHGDLYCGHVRRHAGDSYPISCTSLEDRRYPIGRSQISTTARPVGNRRPDAVICA